MRLKHKVNVIVSDDAAGKNKLFAPDDALSEVQLDGYTEASSGTVVLAAADVFAIPFAGITSARGVYLRATSDFALAVNGGAALNVIRGITGAGNAKAACAKAFLEAALTSVQVTVGATGLTLSYVVWGDPLV